MEVKKYPKWIKKGAKVNFYTYNLLRKVRKNGQIESERPFYDEKKDELTVHVKYAHNGSFNCHGIIGLSELSKGHLPPHEVRR